MKTHLLLALAALALPISASAQAKKAEPSVVPPPAKASEPAKPGKEEPKTAKTMPMNSRIDEIDAAGKSFTQNTRDGRKIKHVITGKTDIKQGRDSAKFEDLKVGDMVAGSRVKKNAEGTEYEVIKVTKFAPKAKPEEKAK